VSSAKIKVLLAMSGGVDSSVAAGLLLRAGYDVVGCFMRLGSPGETLDELTPAGEACETRIGHQGCCSIRDAADARDVAARLGIPLYVCNFKREFGRVIDYFVDEYASGRTPNPCVRCNDWLKFGKLHEYAAQLGAEMVASGHYARVTAEPGGGHRLRRGLDGKKDQSYVLFGLPRAQLATTLFPVGGMPKDEVREHARVFGLPVFDKPDSQEICFVPDQDYAGLVERRRPEMAAKGEVVDAQGNVLGEHQGQHRFTVGQRRGLSLALGRPIYVVSRDAARNRVTVGEKQDLLVGGALAGEANWLEETPALGEWRQAMVKYRYNTPAATGRFRVLEPSAKPGPSGRAGRFEVAFDTPQEAVAPGQAVVLYDAADHDAVLGGGWIAQALAPGA